MKPQSKPILTLAISHNIHLTAEQRRDLAGGESIVARGVSLPVWYSKGKTSEPGREVICTYQIHNFVEAATQVVFNLDGYEFNLPQLGEDPPDNAVHGGQLLDVKYGGLGKIKFAVSTQARMNGVPTIIYHTILISDLDELRNTLIPG